MKKSRPAPFKFKPFSTKQKQVLTWWVKDKSPYWDYDGIVCDGAVRSGKTVVMSFSYILWAMESFENEQFGMAGKTIGSLRRNVVNPLKKMLDARKIKYKDHRSDNFIEITYKGKTNFFYLFGGKDESSQDLIQGITLAGMFFDEVALMPESFVNQATSRCSVDGAKHWFNCNPANPKHWFKENFLDKAEEKRYLHIHFLMMDNLSLSKRVIDRYYRMYTGVFFKRYILGLWVMAEGVIYDMFDEDTMSFTDKDVERLGFKKYWVSIDQGFTNATSFLLHGLGTDDVVYTLKEYYHSGNPKKNPDGIATQKAPSQYAEDLKEWLEGLTDRLGNKIKVDRIFIDPAAKGFISQCYQMGIHRLAPIARAENAVKEGIEYCSSLMSMKRYKVHKDCKMLLREISSYIWDEKAQERGEDKPLKENDDTVDCMRYGIYSMRTYFRHFFENKAA